jgi:hypothetical protein
MTSPGLPPVDYTPAPLTPAGFGLYAAAQILPAPSRILGGVRVWPYNCDTGYGTYSAALCSEDEPAIKAAGDRPEPITYDPTVVWAADECRPDQTVDEVQARANNTLALIEQPLVEAAFATALLADAGAPTVVPDLATAIGTLEEFLGETGHMGVIHAARRWAAPASQYRWSNQSGPSYNTPLGHRWAFGGGYADVLGNTLIATGPVYLWRTEPFEGSSLTGNHVEPRFNNTVYALAERIVVAGYECAVMAVTIDPTP